MACAPPGFRTLYIFQNLTEAESRPYEEFDEIAKLLVFGYIYRFLEKKGLHKKLNDLSLN
jgi:hypothetical protein